MLSDLHYKLIMNEKPQKKGRTQVLAGGYHSCLSGSTEPCMLTQKGQVLGIWTGGTFPSYSLLACLLAINTRHEVCAGGAVRRLQTLPLLRTPETGAAWAAHPWEVDGCCGICLWSPALDH